MFPQFTHWYEGQTRIFDLKNTASHFRGIALFFIFFLSMIYQMLILMDRSFLNRQDFCNFILYENKMGLLVSNLNNEVVLVVCFVILAVVVLVLLTD